jgi:hypothetical protein
MLCEVDMAVATMNGILRSPRFDGFFVIGVPLIAIASGILVASNPELFVPVVMIDLWLLGYHHVISTYTRLAFDAQSFREHRALVVYLLPAVAAGVVLLALLFGPWIVATTYLYWQWWHYTRQSEGISKAYAAKSRDRDFGHPFVRRATFYAVPLLSILTISQRSPDEFLFFPVRTLPIPATVVQAVGAVTVVLLILWTIDQYRAYRRGKLARPYVAYVFSHFLVYYVAYIYLKEINYGWLTINIWHNLQYILFVWLYNNRRFGQSDERGLLARLSQNRRFPLYFASCFAISTLIYAFIDTFVTGTVGAWLALSATTAALIIYQTINFHHYIVDSLIWKLRKPKLQKTLGIG